MCTLACTSDCSYLIGIPRVIQDLFIHNTEFLVAEACRIPTVAHNSHGKTKVHDTTTTFHCGPQLSRHNNQFSRHNNQLSRHSTYLNDTTHNFTISFRLTRNTGIPKQLMARGAHCPSLCKHFLPFYQILVLAKWTEKCFVLNSRREKSVALKRPLLTD